MCLQICSCVFLLCRTNEALTLCKIDVHDSKLKLYDIFDCLSDQIYIDNNQQEKGTIFSIKSFL